MDRLRQRSRRRLQRDEQACENNTATGGDVCGPLNLNFGNPFASTTTVNPDVLHGWGIRRTTGSSASAFSTRS